MGFPSIAEAVRNQPWSQFSKYGGWVGNRLPIIVNNLTARFSATFHAIYDTIQFTGSVSNAEEIDNCLHSPKIPSH